jgi:hypothetical protein
VEVMGRMNDMYAINATQVRNEWSSVSDSVIREKPIFIKKTRDYMMLSEISVVENLLSAYTFTANKYIEDDGSVTLGLVEIDLAENGTDEQDAIRKMADAILDYSQDYYNEFDYWFRGNRQPHLPYVIKALILNDTEKIGGLIKCHPGEI